MKVLILLFFTLINFHVLAGECAPLGNFLDLVFKQRHSVNRAAEIERRFSQITEVPDSIRVRGGNGEYVLARDVRYEDGKIFYKIGDEVQTPYQIGDDFNDFFKLADEVPVPAPAVAADSPPNFTMPGFRPSSLDVAEGRIPDGFIPRETSRPVAPEPDNNLPAVIPDEPRRVVTDVTTTSPDAPVAPSTGTELVPAPSLGLTRVERGQLPSGLPQIEGPQPLPRIEGPPARPLLEGPPATALLEAPPNRPALPGPDDGLRGGPPPRYAVDVPRPTRAQFPESMVGEVITFTSPRGNTVTRGEVVRSTDASVFLKLEDGSVIERRFRDINSESIRILNPRPAAFVARATRTNFPESVIGEVMTFTTPAGRRTSTGRVVRVFDESVVIELPDGSLRNERFRNINGASVQPKRPIPAAFVERPTRLDFPDTLIGRSVTFTSPGGRVSTTGIVQAPINGQSVNVLLPDGTIVNKRFRDMSRASVRETPVPAVVADTDVPAPTRGVELTLSGNRDVTPAGTDVTTRPLTGEVLPPENAVVPSAPRPALEGRLIDGVPYHEVDTSARAIAAASDEVSGVSTSLSRVIRSQENLALHGPNGSAWTGPFGAVDDAGRAIADDEILGLLNNGARLRNIANGMLEFIGQGGRRFFLSARNLADRGLKLLDRAGDVVLDFPKTLRALGAIGTANRIAELGPYLADLFPQETPAEPATDGTPDPAPDPAPDTTPPAAEENTPGDFNTGPPGANDNRDGNTEDTEREEPVPIPPAPRGNPVRPQSAPMQKLNIIRTRGVL